MAITVLENIDADKFHDWLDRAKPGAKLLYHRGELAYQREGIVTINHRLHHVYNEPLHSLAEAVWRAYRRNRVVLTQKRVDYGQFDYYATKRSK